MRARRERPSPGGGNGLGKRREPRKRAEPENFSNFFQKPLDKYGIICYSLHKESRNVSAAHFGGMS